MAFVVVVTLGLAVGVWIEDSRRGWTAERLEQSIAAELPKNCSRDEVAAWFDRHGLEHQFFTDTTGDRSGHDTMPTLVGLRDEDLGGMERAVLEGREANMGDGSSGRISVYFFFDKQGHCVGHLIHRFVYSL